MIKITVFCVLLFAVCILGLSLFNQNAKNILLANNFGNYFQFLNIVVLILTLSVLVRYAFDTNRLARQSEQSNLRPIILRMGFIHGWSSVTFTKDGNEVKGDHLIFSIKKNIATDIEGFIVIDGFRYVLNFTNEISKISNTQSRAEKKWGWQDKDTNIHAVYEPDKKEKVGNIENMILVSYKDIEGNSYYTIEDKDFSQKSFVGSYKLK